MSRLLVRATHSLGRGRCHDYSESYPSQLRCARCAQHVACWQKLLAMADKSGKPIKSKKAVKFVRQGDMVYARLTVPRAICVETFKDFEQFGRFMLRDEGKTIGMGVIKSLG